MHKETVYYCRTFSGLIELPDDWSEMDHRKGFMVIDLPPSDISYELVYRKFTESMSLKSDQLKKVVSVSVNPVVNLC